MTLSTISADSLPTDLHIKIDNLELSLAYPGPRRIADHEKALVAGLSDELRRITGRVDLMVNYQGTFWRGRYDRHAVDGSWYRLRRMAEVAPELETLPSPMPASIRQLLLAPQLGRGGFIPIVGGTGCGKTTTGGAILVSRLKKYGGVAYTTEDPPELPLNGWHGQGYCTQTWVPGDTSADWTEAMRGVLRSQPTGTPVLLYVGEMRDADTVRVALRGASNGFLVVCSGFGSDIISGIDTIFQLAGREYAATLAATLRIILHQTIDNGRFTVQTLVSESAASPVAAIIRGGNLAGLQNEIMYQRNQLVAGRPLFTPAQ